MTNLKDKFIWLFACIVAPAYAIASIYISGTDYDGTPFIWFLVVSFAECFAFFVTECLIIHIEDSDTFFEDMQKLLFIPWLFHKIIKTRKQSETEKSKEDVIIDAQKLAMITNQFYACDYTQRLLNSSGKLLHEADLLTDGGKAAIAFATKSNLDTLEDCKKHFPEAYILYNAIYKDRNEIKKNR